MWNMGKRDKNPVQWVYPPFWHNSLPPPPPPRKLSGIHIRLELQKERGWGAGNTRLFQSSRNGRRLPRRQIKRSVQKLRKLKETTSKTTAPKVQRGNTAQNKKREQSTHTLLLPSSFPHPHPVCFSCAAVLRDDGHLPQLGRTEEEGGPIM